MWYVSSYLQVILVSMCEYTSICPCRNNASTALVCKAQKKLFCLSFFCFRKPVVEMKSGTPTKKKKHCNCKNSQCLKLWVQDFLFQSCTSFIKTLNVVEWYMQMHTSTLHFLGNRDSTALLCQWLTEFWMHTSELFLNGKFYILNCQLELNGLISSQKRKKGWLILLREEFPLLSLSSPVEKCIKNTRLHEVVLSRVMFICVGQI